MKTRLSKVLILFAAILVVILSPVAQAMILQGHSPVQLLVTDPSGNRFGCLSGSCSPSDPCYSVITNEIVCSDSNLVNELPSGEGAVTATYVFCPNGSPDCPTIYIPNPSPGTWKVTYYSTLTGSQTGSVTVTVACDHGLDPVRESCPPITVIPKTPITAGSYGSATFAPPPPTISTPEFSEGMILVIAILLPALLIVVRHQREHQPGSW